MTIGHTFPACYKRIMTCYYVILNYSSENETKMYESGAVKKMVDQLVVHSKDEELHNSVVCSYAKFVRTCLY